MMKIEAGRKGLSDPDALLLLYSKGVLIPSAKRKELPRVTQAARRKGKSIKI